MKKILIVAALAGLSATSTLAADLPARTYTKAPPVVAAPYSWSGFYLGVNAGFGVGRNPTVFTSTGIGGGVATTNLGPIGAIGGGQIGYNWQSGVWVLGVETDIQASGIRDEQLCTFVCRPGAFVFTADQRLNWFGTTRARVGLASGPVLSYVTGGFAYGGVQTDIATNTGVNSPAASFKETRTGWTYGTGVEASLGGNWTGKVEYLYLDLGKQTGAATFGGGAGAATFETKYREHIMRAGLNYKIGGNAAYVPAPVANWAGFYVGANAGSIVGRNQVDSAFTGGGTIFARFTEMPKGYIGGVQGGYNWQAANWVFGVEADIQGTNAKDDDNCHGRCTVNANITYQQRMNWLATARGRIGYSVGPTLFYGTAGAAWAKVKTDVQVAPGNVAFTSAVSISHNRTGWTAGGGMETPLDFFGLLGKNWTAKTEYLYVDLGRTTDVYPAPVFGTHTMEQRLTAHVFTGGINYHFNAPVVAKY